MVAIIVKVTADKATSSLPLVVFQLYTNFPVITDLGFESHHLSWFDNWYHSFVCNAVVLTTLFSKDTSISLLKKFLLKPSTLTLSVFLAFTI